jgi:hypothetical protein
MSCCGEKRQAMRAVMQRQAPSSAAPRLPSGPTVPIIYRGESSLVVRGPATGTTYLFGSRGEPLHVDERDAVELQRSSNFQLG